MLSQPHTKNLILGGQLFSHQRTQINWCIRQTVKWRKNHINRGWRGRGGGAGEREAEEERAGSGSSKRAGSGREMRNANYFNLTMR